MAMVIQAYRFALDPTPRQRRALASHCGAARYAYNWGLQLVQERLEQQRAGEDTEVPWTLPALRWEWNRAKQQAAPWWAENSKEAYSSGLDGLARALKNFSDSKAGHRKGRRMGFPRPKRKGRCRDACRFTTRPLRVEADRKHITLPRIGTLKSHESTRKLARRLEQGTARILAATITHTADRWFVSFTVEVQRQIPAGNGKSTVVGVDVGVRHLAVLSTGVVIPNPHALQRSLGRLRRLNRELHRRRPGSRRRDQTRRRLARVHARASNLRRDALHKLTTTLATECGTIVVEQLKLSGLVRNRRLARALSDAGLAQLRRQLTYKTVWYGSRLMVADPFYPSSKTCSNCGWVKAKLTLAERTFTCEACGLVLDRDLNAARNLAKLAETVAQSGWETQNAREGDVRPGPPGRPPSESGSRHRLRRVRPTPTATPDWSPLPRRLMLSAVGMPPGIWPPRSRSSLPDVYLRKKRRYLRRRIRPGRPVAWLGRDYLRVPKAVDSPDPTRPPASLCGLSQIWSQARYWKSR